MLSISDTSYSEPAEGTCHHENDLLQGDVLHSLK